MQKASAQLDPGPILEAAFAFWSSKVLLTAVGFGVFTKLGDRRVTGTELGSELGMHHRGIADFFDALVAMRFLDREGDGPAAKYFNTPAGALYLDSSSPRYVGGWLAMLNDRLFKFWHDLPEALRTGQPQNETRHGQKGLLRQRADHALVQSSSRAVVDLFDTGIAAQFGPVHLHLVST